MSSKWKILDFQCYVNGHRKLQKLGSNWLSSNKYFFLILGIWTSQARTSSFLLIVQNLLKLRPVKRKHMNTRIPIKMKQKEAFPIEIVDKLQKHWRFCWLIRKKNRFFKKSSKNLQELQVYSSENHNLTHIQLVRKNHSKFNALLIRSLSRRNLSRIPLSIFIPFIGIFFL